MANEFEEHDTESTVCKCLPRVKILKEGEILVIHSPLRKGVKELDISEIDKLLDQEDFEDDTNIHVEGI